MKPVVDVLIDSLRVLSHHQLHVVAIFTLHEFLSINVKFLVEFLFALFESLFG
jgi:hypothetical protein